MNNIIGYSAILLLLLTGCIGEESVDEEEINQEELIITSTISSLKLGESYQLEFEYKNKEGVQTDDVSTEWESTAPEILSVSNEGEITGTELGEAMVFLTVNESLSDFIEVVVADSTIFTNSRKGEFEGANGYNVSGNCELILMEEELELKLKSDFNSESGPGLFVYLSNSASSVSDGISLGELKSNEGTQSYIVEEGIELSTYDYVIIYCKPFGVPFGQAQLD